MSKPSNIIMASLVDAGNRHGANASVAAVDVVKNGIHVESLVVLAKIATSEKCPPVHEAVHEVQVAGAIIFTIAMSNAACGSMLSSADEAHKVIDAAKDKNATMKLNIPAELLDPERLVANLMADAFRTAMLGQTENAMEEAGLSRGKTPAGVQVNAATRDRALRMVRALHNSLGKLIAEDNKMVDSN